RHGPLRRRSGDRRLRSGHRDRRLGGARRRPRPDRRDGEPRIPVPRQDPTALPLPAAGPLSRRRKHRARRKLHLSLISEETRVPSIPFAENVFTWPSQEPQLIGSRCASCAAVTFPAEPSCPRCGGVAMERHLLARRGRLVTWTTQGFLPKEPYAGGETAETF